MRVLIDLNMILDVIQERPGLHISSSAVLQLVVEEKLLAVIPGHLLTTLYYITSKHSSKDQAEMLLDWILRYFEVGIESKVIFLRAQNMHFKDYEDAVAASVAEAEKCMYIITRNVKDFRNSPVKVLTPEEFLTHFSASV